MQVATIIKQLGGSAKVGALCKVTRQAVEQWSRIPAEHVLLLARSGEVTPHEMRRDLYPHPLDGTRKAKPKPANGATR